ncbi:MAG: exonuclease domain-containing protein [Maricaulaceae bacterium]
MTKPNLIALMAGHICSSGFKRSWKKDVLVDAALAYMPFENTVLPANFVTQGRTESLRYLSYLHFGKIEDNLQSFTLRDLGIRKTPNFKADYSARFDTLAEAKAAYFYADGLHKFHHGNETDVTDFIDTVEYWPDPECDISTASHDKLLQKLGGMSERLGDIETALKLYGLSDHPLCNERIIRLRYKRGDKDWCRVRLERLIENPGSDDEHNFAEDFYQRKFKKKRTSQVTDILRQGEVLKLDEAFKNSPERAAQRYYSSQGYTVYFTENRLWRTLFGLLFWEELYCAKAAALHNSFENVPTSLKTGVFYSQFETKIETKLSSLSSASNSYLQILKTVSRHHGTPNGIFRWSGKSIDLIKTLIEVAPSAALVEILRRMAKDYKATRDGFPDLMLIKGDVLRFVEVKASGDVIRRNQLTRIKQLRAAGIQTDIARIDWVIDPNQIYVVVDVETTGGRPGLHRITEIGAVKIQNGHVIDEFQTLLNPERSIPPFITKLTGITNEMVANAPLFADVADSFSKFMGDAIFAAHNVNFDYGFVNAEYARIDKRFRHAKICTCSTMRKHYPGYRSYSLKNLCQEFQINLESHHRALCDAKAAAELLFLVNDKRAA